LPTASKIWSFQISGETIPAFPSSSDGLIPDSQAVIPNLSIPIEPVVEKVGGTPGF
jgi:hypothetical protein